MSESSVIASKRETVETKYMVYLVQPLEERILPGVALEVADRLNVSISKFSKLLADGPGPLTKPTSAKVAERVARVLREAGVVVKIEAVQPASTEEDDAATAVSAPSERSEVYEPIPAKPTVNRWLLGMLIVALLAAASLMFTPVRQAVLAFVEPVPVTNVPVQATADNALAALQQRAEAGAPDAQYELGWYYAASERNLKVASQWFQRAADQGHPDAQYQLALHYLYGHGVARDSNQAIIHLQAAAEQGLAEAQLRLGQQYASGDGVTPDPEQARTWLTLAYQQGVAEAGRLLAQLEPTVPATTVTPPIAEVALPSSALLEAMAAVAAMQTVSDVFPTDLSETDTDFTVQTETDTPVADPSTDLGPVPTSTTPIPANTHVAVTAPAVSSVAAPSPGNVLPTVALPPAPPTVFQLAREGSVAALQATLPSAVDMNTRDEYGQTPLMYAASSNDATMVAFLLGSGADINARSNAGWTALMYAARDNPQLLSTLLQAGADHLVINGDGQSAADLTAQHHPEFLTVFQ
jgi:ankyrin repeat protein